LRGDGDDRDPMLGAEAGGSPSIPMSPLAPTAALGNGNRSEDQSLFNSSADLGANGTGKKAGTGRNAPINPLSRRFGRAVVSEDDVEREFWRLTESSYDTVEVEYGADVHSTTHGRYVPPLIQALDSHCLRSSQTNRADAKRRADNGDTPKRSIL
jgi:hypothetical protein